MSTGRRSPRPPVGRSRRSPLEGARGCRRAIAGVSRHADFGPVQGRSTRVSREATARRSRPGPLPIVSRGSALRGARGSCCCLEARAPGVNVRATSTCAEAPRSWRPAGRRWCCHRVEVAAGRARPACSAGSIRRRSSTRPIVPPPPSRLLRVARHPCRARFPAGDALRACRGPHRPGPGERMVGVSPTPKP